MKQGNGDSDGGDDGTDCQGDSESKTDKCVPSCPTLIP